MIQQNSSTMNACFLLGSEKPFAGKCVWVTGAAQGIGLAIAQSFQQLGAQLVALDCQFPALSEPVEHERVLLDITNPAQVDEVTNRLLQGGMAPQILVNAAGVLRLGKLDAQAEDGLSLTDWQACFDVNVSGVFYLLRNLIPHFKTQGNGSIVNLASNAAHVPRANMGAYCASKSALVSLSNCVALELAAYGVRCNLVSPGSTDTPMLRAMLGDATAQQGVELFAPTIRGLPEQFKLGIPLKKVATAQEIANAVLFLASDLASHITMQDIVVDGGATLAA
ncbi:MAG: 2,3-dihydro-2,3-dihydroxybenzoate dehydrogenase [Cellvibrio sp.]|uniref:2,3-dihydro-2,3-dihydroxybenzoate dehydrogenase n=1 Tax=Cellvibrio sp. TaxID=1965322 RepID=UPI0031A18F15